MFVLLQKLGCGLDVSMAASHSHHLSSPYHIMFLSKELKLERNSHHDLIHGFLILINFFLSYETVIYQTLQT